MPWRFMIVSNYSASKSLLWVTASSTSIGYAEDPDYVTKVRQIARTL